jgi:hypothetical protein
MSHTQRSIDHLDGHAFWIELFVDHFPMAICEGLFEDGSRDTCGWIWEKPGEFAWDAVRESENTLKEVERFAEIVPLLDHFVAERSLNSGFAVNDGNGDLLNHGSGPLGFIGGFGAVSFEVLLKKAVFTLKRTLSGSFVAQREVMTFDIGGAPGVWRRGSHREKELVMIALGTEAIPLGLSNFEYEIELERVVSGLIGGAPTGEEKEPVFFGLVGKDKGFGASAVLGGVLRRDELALGRGRAGAARVALLFLGGRGGREIFGFGKHVILS